MKKKSGKKEGEKHYRTLVKAISWRIIASVTTMAIVFAFTGKLALSLGVGLVEVVLKMLFYYLHERAWQKILWGKTTHPLAAFQLTRELEPQDEEIIRQKLRELGYLD